MCRQFKSFKEIKCKDIINTDDIIIICLYCMCRFFLNKMYMYGYLNYETLAWGIRCLFVHCTYIVCGHIHVLFTSIRHEVQIKQI